MFNDENVTGKTDWYRAKTVRAVNGKKVILYIADDAVRNILRQLKVNGGQLSDITAKAIGMTVANSLKWDDTEFQLSAKEEHDSITKEEYGIEESDDDRTWKYEEE